MFGFFENEKDTSDLRSCKINEIEDFPRRHILSSPFRKMENFKNGISVVNIGLGIATDEMSANRSKRWNHVENCWVLFMNFKKKFRVMELLCSTQDGNWRDVGEVVLEEYDELKNGFICMQKDGSSIIIVGTIFCFICDNPRAAQICSSVGASGIKICRICHFEKSSTTRVKENNAVKSVHQIGSWNISPFQFPMQLRTREETISIQIQEAMLTSQDEKKIHQRNSGIVCCPEIQPYLTYQSIDPHEMCVIEVLHTILLGPIKYILKVINCCLY